jgi:hypothetical protein
MMHSSAIFLWEANLSCVRYPPDTIDPDNFCLPQARLGLTYTWLGATSFRWKIHGKGNVEAGTMRVMAKYCESFWGGLLIPIFQQK